MRIEGYLFVPYRGQYRFSFAVNKEQEELKISELRESSRDWDYLWDVAMRRAPTLRELVEAGAQQIYQQHRKPIFDAFDQEKHRVMHSRHSIVRHQLKGAWVEFINVT